MKKKGGEKMINTLKKIGASVAIAAVTTASFAMPALAASTTYTPYTFIGSSADCGGAPAGTPGGASATTSGGTLTLTKSDPTNYCSAAGATFNNVPSTISSLSFTHTGYCGAGAPRFNVYTSNYGTIFLGCTYGDPTNSGTATFTAGQTYGGVLFPSDAIVTGLELVQDETGTAVLGNIMVNGQTAALANAPTTKDQCKNGGYKTATDLNGKPFSNQGQCVSYFNHVKHGQVQ